MEALLRVARRALRLKSDWVIAAAAFLALFVFAVPFPVIVLAAGLVGFLRGSTGMGVQMATRVNVFSTDTARTVAIWLAVWLRPLLAVASIFGRDHVLSQLAWFFSKLSVVTFGGAYAVLAYMAQEVVQGYGWLKPGEILDASCHHSKTRPPTLAAGNQNHAPAQAFTVSAYGRLAQIDFNLLMRLLAAEIELAAV